MQYKSFLRQRQIDSGIAGNEAAAATVEVLEGPAAAAAVYLLLHHHHYYKENNSQQYHGMAHKVDLVQFEQSACNFDTWVEPFALVDGHLAWFIVVVVVPLGIMYVYLIIKISNNKSTLFAQPPSDLITDPSPNPVTNGLRASPRN
jgi:hypothetical protein